MANKESVCVVPTSLSASVSTDLVEDDVDEIILRQPCNGSMFGRYSVSTEYSWVSFRTEPPVAPVAPVVAGVTDEPATN